jgi:hypothetical protein
MEADALELGLILAEAETLGLIEAEGLIDAE